VQDHRQAEAAREPQLGTVKVQLPRRIEPRHEMVEPDFADRHEARVAELLREQRLERGQVFVGCGARVERVDAQRIAVAKALREPLHRGPAGARDGRQHAVAHAKRGGLLAHSIHVAREFGGVEVAVGVYEAAAFHSKKPCYTAIDVR
jgi:hypothetical protein